MMDKENKRKGDAIDEQQLMALMAGGVRKEGFENNAKQDSAIPRAENSVPKTTKAEKRGPQELDYEALFFSNTSGNARNGKSVYIRPEFHERLTRIVQVIGEDKISLYTYLDNVLEHHFREFGEQIIKAFNNKYRPIL
jgi:hypothetical protein